MMTNKLSKAFLTAFLMATGLMLTSLLMTGCKSSTEPTSAQEYDSQVAMDLTATSLGTESGGAGVNFSDAQGLIDQGSIPDLIGFSKGGIPLRHTTSYDSTTGLHTDSITRMMAWGNFDFSATIVYKYTFRDVNGNFMQKFVKGTTNSIVFSVSKQRSFDKGERVDVDDTAFGSWTLSNLVSGPAILDGSYSRSGTDVFHTAANGDRTFTHSMTINFLSDTLVKASDKHCYLAGPGTSHFEATTPKGYHVVRDTKITFNGDGTATLEVTRTSGDGTVDTYTIDTKVGRFKKFGR